MKEKKSVAVWLICEDGSLAGKVLLQQRAETKTEEGTEKPQSNPYVCQPTWNGKVEKSETIPEVTKKEAKEELGEDFAHCFDFSSLDLFYTERYSFRGETYRCYNFVGLVTQKQLELVKLHAGALSEFIGVNSRNLPKIEILGTPEADPKTQIVLFEDQYNALETLFILKEKLAYLR
jgi:8-oxo-dGTP pyrophosphatase MutT (NUDIX family)